MDPEPHLYPSNVIAWKGRTLVSYWMHLSRFVSIHRRGGNECRWTSKEGRIVHHYYYYYLTSLPYTIHSCQPSFCQPPPIFPRALRLSSSFKMRHKIIFASSSFIVYFYNVIVFTKIVSSSLSREHIVIASFSWTSRLFSCYFPWVSPAWRSSY